MIKWRLSLDQATSIRSSGTSWITEIENGNFESDLVNLTLHGKGNTKYEGQGRLEWTHGDASLFAVTDGGGSAFSNFVGTMPGKPGELIPADEYLRLEATSQEGWTVVCDRLSNGRFYEVHGQSALTWKFRNDDFLSELQITRSASHRFLGSGLEAIVTNFHPDSWTRSSSFVYDNKRFGTEIHELDWLEFDCRLGSVAIQKRDNGFAKLRLDSVNGDSESTPDIRCVCSALALLTGRRVEWIAQQANNPSTQDRRLTTRGSRFCKQRYMGPFANDRRLSIGIESFLGKATDYFATDEGKRVAGLVDACINSTDNNFTTQAMVLCATVESLADTYKSVIPRTQENQGRKELLDGVRKAIGPFLVSKGVEDSDRKRIDGLFGMLHSTQVKSTLDTFRKLNWARITSDEIRAWASLRNQVMHGSLVLADASLSKWQNEINGHQLVANLINKILLQVIGYCGPFFDYSVWNIANFNPAILNDLQSREDDPEPA